MSLGFAFIAHDTVLMRTSLHILSFSLYFYFSFNPESDLQYLHKYLYVDYLNWAEKMLGYGSC
jgi:hypothetical protein